VLLDMVDLTPVGADMTPGDHASAVAKRDRAALMVSEDAFEAAERQDAPLRIELDLLDGPRTRDVSR
jgi:hypothetical protein